VAILASLACFVISLSPWGSPWADREMSNHCAAQLPAPTFPRDITDTPYVKLPAQYPFLTRASYMDPWTKQQYNFDIETPAHDTIYRNRRQYNDYIHERLKQTTELEQALQLI
jgi:hypothetical protein